MIEILGIKLSYEAIGFFVAFIASEVIGANKNLKNNSVAGLVKTIVDGQRPFRKEDDKINAIKAQVAAIYNEIESLGK